MGIEILHAVTAIQRGASEPLGHMDTCKGPRHVYNPAIEIRLQALAHSPTSDLTVTPGEEETPHLHTVTLTSGRLCLLYSGKVLVSACTPRGVHLPSRLSVSFKIAAVQERADFLRDNSNNNKK